MSRATPEVPRRLKGCDEVAGVAVSGGIFF